LRNGFETMHRTPIGIRGLFDRALRAGAMTPEERAQLLAALETVGPDDAVQLALGWLPLLLRRGVLTPLEPDWTGPEIRLRFALPDSIDRIAIPLPSRSPAPGLVLLRTGVAALLAPPAPRTLEALRRMGASLLGETGQLVGRAEMLRAAEAAAQDALDGVPAAYFPLDARRAAEAAYAQPPDIFSYLSPWAEALDAPGPQMLVAQRTDRLPADETDAAQHGIGSLLGVEVHSAEAGVHGYLEWRALPPEFFTAERLAQAAHVAAGLGEHLTRAARLESLIYVDRTTGAFNRNHFQRALAGEVARAKRDAKPMALLIADIDDFKRFNTAYGYEAGNQVLAAVAAILQNGIRPFDSVARWGGEEFAVILSAPVGPEEAQSVAERLRQQIESTPVEVTGLDGVRSAVQVTASMGVALFPLDGGDPAALWRAANRALLAAKRPPKNRVALASELEPGATPAGDPERRRRRRSSTAE
jgi:diguanylate cyclase (GGDEF)-like protein